MRGKGRGTASENLSLSTGPPGWPGKGAYRGAVLSRLSLLAGGSGRTLQTGVTSSAGRAAVPSNTFGTIFSRRTRRTRRSRVSLGRANSGSQDSPVPLCLTRQLS